MHTPSAASYREHLRRLSALADHALERGGYARLAIYSGALPMLFLDDQNHPFKVNPHFKAWLPVLDSPDSFLVYTPGARPQLIFNQPVDYWYMPPTAPSGFWTSEFDILPVPDLAAARALLPRELGNTACIGELPAQVQTWGFGALNPAALLDTLHYARAVKSEYEIECMSAATALAVRGHRAAEKVFHAGGSEFDAHQAYLSACGQREEELPYNNIVAFNTHGAVLHYQFLDRKPPAAGQRNSFLIDAGAAYNGYACDITRTHAARPGEFADLVGEMDRLQLRLCAALRAGVDYRDFQILAHHEIAALLRSADVIRVDAEAAVAGGLSSLFFPHGVGHLLGLQVHDVGGFMRDETGGSIERPAGHPYLRLTRRLEPGFVVTVEPGLYFIDQLLAPARTNGQGRHINWNRVDAFRPYGGIRIEDDVAITASGHRNLTRAAFTSSPASP